MDFKIVYQLLGNNKIKHKEVPADYKLEHREVFDTKGYLKPIWSDEIADVVEGASAEEIQVNLQHLSKQYEFVLQEEIENLTIGAKKIAYQLNGSNEYIKAQISSYQQKYLIAIGTLPDTLLNGIPSLSIEAAMRSISVEDLKQQIIDKNTIAVSMEQQFMSMIELARLKVKTYIADNLFADVNNLIGKMQLVQLTTSIEDIQKTMDSILNY
ncbi:hypothetical protein EZY14_002785 [Kordia sp. TARA_039_SRF]|nr:hypothetical protein EZY14_002785 [Kordia sp. TARA_039_SRF]